MSGWSTSAALACVLGVLAGCGDGVAPEQGDVSLSFRTVEPPAEDATPGSFVVTGRNGTIRIDRLLMVVGDFRLEQIGEACVGVEQDFDPLDGCEGFIAEPVLLDIPLDGTGVFAVREQIGTGRFPGLLFEVQDIVDEDDPSGRSIVEGRVRSRVGDWPDASSFLIEGAFIPLSGTPRPFRVFAVAEVEVALALDVPIRVEADELVEATVVIDPSRWLLERNGDVLDLSGPEFAGGTDGFLDLSETLLEGFTSVEVVEED